LGKVTKVVDGDTIKAIVNLNSIPTKFVFRIGGVDTPETRKGEAK
jgi:endonuclease YncB( thermonuclease family)